VKRILLLLLSLALAMTVCPQKQTADTNYANRVTSVTWMPDGKSFLFSVVKFHRHDRQAPFFSKVFRYDLSTTKIIGLFENGSNLAPSPDCNSIAFLKRDDRVSSDIHVYHLEKKEQSLLATDSTKKNALAWSPDGKKIMYNISHRGEGQNSIIEICVLDLATKKVKQVTQSHPHKSYNPAWCPDSKRIVYYFEKGDGHDQVWLTDDEGSFHRNLTNDTTTHNYFPSWINEKTIFYTQSPETIITMNIDGSNRQKLEGLNHYHPKYSPVAGLFAYVQEDPDNKVVLFDWKKKTTKVLLDEETIKGLY
jgi:Tol biopolymer transport system component